MEWTSFQAVNALKWTFRKQFDLPKKFKIGHTGTLDPLATGLLVICTGKATKQIPTFQDAPKAYTGTISLGATTPSYDLETEIDETFPVDHITEDILRTTAHRFLGIIEQTPPIYSAVKKDGKRAYELAEKGEDVKLKSRKVEISKFDLTRINIPEIDFHIGCSKGTYIRTIASDFGKKMDNGGHLSALRRTEIGQFHVDNAVSPLLVKSFWQ